MQGQDYGALIKLAKPIVLVLLIVFAGVVLVRFVGLSLGPHHEVRRSAAHLDRRIKRFLRHRRSRVGDAEQAIDLALEVTGEILRLDLDHRTDLSFAPRPRRGNPTEYAQLFIAVIKRLRPEMEACVIRSRPVKMFSVPLKKKQLRSHDWAWLRERDYVWLIDPALADAHLGRSLLTNVTDPRAIKGCDRD